MDAVTRTRRRKPTSAVATMYCVVVAPPIAAQFAPLGSPPSRGHLTHWYAKLVGAPLQDPWLAVSVRPTTGLPEIRGSAVLFGTAWLRAELPPGSARTVASDASAAATSVHPMLALREVRIAVLSSEVTTRGLTRDLGELTASLRKIHPRYETLMRP